MNGKKRKATKSDTADGKMVRKNSKNLDGMNPTRLIRIIGLKQARNKITIVRLYNFRIFILLIIKVKSRLGTMICRITVVDGAMKIAGMSHRFSPKGNQLFQNSLKVAGKKHANGMRKKVSLYYYWSSKIFIIHFSHPTKTSSTSSTCSSTATT